MGKTFVGGLLVLFVLVPALGAERNLHSAGNAQFEIVGLHGRSVGYVDELSRHTVEVAARYLDPEGLQFPQRILVSLKPEKYADFEGNHALRLGKRGFVNLDLRWNESLSLMTTCRALSEALLVRYSIFNYGESGPDFLPRWPASAIGLKAYLSLRPAQSSRLGGFLDLEATPTVGSLLQRSWRDAGSDANGYAFLLALEQSGVERGRIKQLVKQSLSGQDITPGLTSLLPPGDPAAENERLADWWAASLERLMTPPSEAMETMATSRQWIGMLADLANTEYKELNLSRLWDMRDDEALRDLIQARYEIVRLRITRVNPAYFNAARSLGALFETYLHGDKRHEYIHRLTGFLGDFEDSKELEGTVRRALDQKSSGPDG